MYAVKMICKFDILIYLRSNACLFCLVCKRICLCTVRTKYSSFYLFPCKYLDCIDCLNCFNSILTDCTDCTNWIDCRNFRDWRSEKVWLNHSLSDNLKTRDASASKNDQRNSRGMLRQKFNLSVFGIWHLNIWTFEKCTFEHLNIRTLEHWNINCIDTV